MVCNACENRSVVSVCNYAHVYKHENTYIHTAALGLRAHPPSQGAQRARKMRVNGRGESQICLVFCKNFRLSVSESESSLVWREAQKTRGGFPFLGVAERVKLGPLEGWGTFLKDNQQFIRCFWNCLIDNYGLQRMWKQECCECLYIHCYCIMFTNKEIIKKVWF